MISVAEDEPPSRSDLLAYIGTGRAWLAEIEGRGIGYALAEVVDAAGHLEQVSIHPEFGRQGIGRKLIETVVSWARAERMPYLSLLTFREVPWNGPYYERLGFRLVKDAELLPELRARREHERQLGLDVAARGAMRLFLDDQ